MGYPGSYRATLTIEATFYSWPGSILEESEGLPTKKLASVITKKARTVREKMVSFLYSLKVPFGACHTLRLV